MTIHQGAGPAAGIAQAAPAPHPAERTASTGHRLSGRPAVFVLGSLIVALLASSAAPTPLYAIYQARWHFTPITTTVVFGVYAIAVLAPADPRQALRPRRTPADAADRDRRARGLAGDLRHRHRGAPLLAARVVQGLSTGAALGAIGAAMLDMDRELGTFANAVAPGRAPPAADLARAGGPVPA